MAVCDGAVPAVWEGAHGGHASVCQVCREGSGVAPAAEDCRVEWDVDAVRVRPDGMRTNLLAGLIGIVAAVLALKLWHWLHP